jgi:chitinase
MRLSAASLLALTCVVNAAVIPHPIRGLNDTVTAAATGYKNVAYYVNWVYCSCSFPFLVRNPLTLQ